jgi:hypothetical protein
VLADQGDQNGTIYRLPMYFTAVYFERFTANFKFSVNYRGTILHIKRYVSMLTKNGLGKLICCPLRQHLVDCSENRAARFHFFEWSSRIEFTCQPEKLKWIITTHYQPHTEGTAISLWCVLLWGRKKLVEWTAL